MTTPRRRRETPHRRNRIIAGVTASALFVAVIVAVALGGSDNDPEAVADGASPSATTGTTSTADGVTGAPTATGTSGSPNGRTNPSEDAILTPTELEPFLLRGSDLPPGWRTLDAAITATSTLMGSCLLTAITPTVPHVAKTTSFRSGSNGPVLTAAVRDFTTPAQSARAMTEVRRAVLGCVRGKPALRTITLTSKADASVAVTFVVTQEGSSARGEVLVAQVGARSATVALIGLTDQDLERGKDALRTMIARLD